MKKLSTIETSEIDSVMSAIGSVFKAIIAVAKCVDNFKESELNRKPVV